jgi:SNF2 family DNA or RNA helicase
VYFVVKNLLAHHGLNNVLVADDMGMGKTFIALAAVFFIR